MSLAKNNVCPHRAPPEYRNALHLLEPHPQRQGTANLEVFGVRVSILRLFWAFGHIAITYLVITYLDHIVSEPLITATLLAGCSWVPCGIPEL
jgi:hypothetical protein